MLECVVATKFRKSRKYEFPANDLFKFENKYKLQTQESNHRPDRGHAKC